MDGNTGGSCWKYDVARLAAVAALAAALAAGCQSRRAEPPAGESSPDSPQSASATDREIWEVAFIQGVRVGYARTTIRRLEHDGEDLVAIDGTTHLALRRFGTPMDMDMRFASTETSDGRLVTCESVINQAANAVVTRGRVVNGRLELQITTSGKTTTETIPWSADDGGFYALQQSLARRPMQPGEKRTIRGLDPSTNNLSATELVARDTETVKLLGKTAELLRIDGVTTLDNRPFKETLWADRKGEIWKTETDVLSMETVRTTKEEALRATDSAPLDFAWNVAIKVDHRLKQPHATKRVRYRVHVERENPAAVFASGPSQQVRPVDANTAEVTVYALRPGDSTGNPEAKPDPPTAKDREPNNWIQSDHPEIVAAAKEAAGDVKDPWALAVALERYAHDRIPRPGFSQAFDTAVDVLRSGEGDCTEHAVLLAALARARGIPARVAIGLVYQKQTFLYHMWTEMFLEGRWIPMDATLAQGGIGAAHLKLVASNLAGASALSCFLPVAQVAGRLKIEILDAQ